MGGRTHSTRRWALPGVLAGAGLAVALVLWTLHAADGTYARPAGGRAVVANDSDPPAPPAVLAAPAADPAPTAPESAPDLVLDADRAERSSDEPAAAAPERRPAAARVHAVRGRVVAADTSEPLPGCVAQFSGPDRDDVVAVTGADGAFVLSVAEPVLGALAIRPPAGWIVRDGELPLLGSAPRDLVFLAERWPPESAGSISGRLVSARGAWSDADIANAGSIVVDIVSDTEPRIVRQSRVDVASGEDGGFEITFEFPDVPLAEYLLTVSSLDHHSWSPAGLVVTPPAENLELVRMDVARTVTLEFRVLDAESGEPVPDWRATHVRQTVSTTDGLLLHAGPLDREGFPVDGALTWCVAAPGYAAAYGDETAFAEGEGEEEGTWTAEVRLRRGWSTRFVVIGRSPTMRPLVGATIHLDGEQVGTTDGAGGLNVSRAEAPERLEVRYLDWEVEGDPLERTARGSSLRSRVTVVQMVRPR